MNQNRVPIKGQILQPKLAHCSPGRKSSPAPGHSSDTLHCTKHVLGEAVQFNSSVSAMPEHAPEYSRPGSRDGGYTALMLAPNSA